MAGEPAAQGDCDASSSNGRFTTAYSSHYQALRSYLIYRTHDASVADDLTSATFEFAWRRISEMPQEPATHGWLKSISKTILWNYWRSTTRQHNLILKIASSSARWVGPSSDGVEDAFPLQALDALPPRERIALQLVYWDGLRHSEAAEVLDCSVNAFDILIHRARRHMLVILNSSPAGTGQKPKDL
jgi:RNA polymerase sigma factor (sigma-70 family)